MINIETLVKMTFYSFESVGSLLGFFCSFGKCVTDSHFSALLSSAVCCLCHLPSHPRFFGASIPGAFCFITERGTCRASAKALFIQSHLVKESIMSKGPLLREILVVEAAHSQQSISPPNDVLLCLARVLMGTLPP